MQEDNFASEIRAHLELVVYTKISKRPISEDLQGLKPACSEVIRMHLQYTHIDKTVHLFT